MKLGALTIDPVYDGYGHEVVREFLAMPGVADPWERCAPYLDEAGNLPFVFGGFLLRSAGRVVLIDTGVGPLDRERMHGGRLLDSLRELGVEPGDVTDVLFTHLHFDHVGWATRRGAMVFENATYRVHAADWAYFVERPEAEPGAVRKLTPLAARLEPFDAEMTLLPGLDVRPLPGHTPGTTVFVASSGAERAVLLGDVMHTPAELVDLAWECLWDVDRVAARRMRAELVAETADRPDILASAHFPCGRVVTVDGGLEFRFLD
jgi:glyoxylase-like metal-dependent hydrolase (beta-lactamase superfamily II)